MKESRFAVVPFPFVPMEVRMASESPVGVRFDKAQFDEGGGGAGLSCAFCRRGIAGSYYEVNGRTACESCRRQAERLRPQGFSLGRGLRALVGGGAGGAVGALLYYAVARLTGYELGLIAIIVGLLVGFGVRWGSGGVGGRGYQILAVAITYMAIVSTYAPFIIEAIRNQAKAEETAGAASGAAPQTQVETAAVPGAATAGSSEVKASPEKPTPGMVVLALGAFALLVMASPFLAGVQNVIGIVIIGIALYEAWKVNRFTPLAIEGPFQVGSDPSAVTPR
jgi:hypothetical protein